MAEELKTFGGEIETQFIYRPNETSLMQAEHAVRMDQEAICGYRLAMLKQRSMELADAHGPYVEVFVRYGPYPVITEEMKARDPSLRAPPEPEPIKMTFVDGTKI